MSVRDAINHALQDNPSELKNSIYSALDAKVADSLELKKISTASEYFNIPEEEEYYEEEDVDEGAIGDAAKAVGSSVADAARTATHKVRLSRTREKYHRNRYRSEIPDDEKKAGKHWDKAEKIAGQRRQARKVTGSSPSERRDARRTATPSTR